MIIKHIFIFIFLFNHSFAKVIYKESKWVDKNLSHKDQDLKFSMRTRKYEVIFDDGYKTYGTKSTFILEVTDEIALLQYAVRQYVKGKVYSSEIVNGKVKKIFNYRLNSKGKLITFNLNDYVIESLFPSEILGHVDKDKSENYYYKVPYAVFDIDSKRYDYLGKLKEFELRPHFYLNYWSPQYFNEDGIAKNIDVQYRSCLVYLPDKTKNLVCFNWHDQGIFH